jgi:hypothetical protein
MNRLISALFASAILLACAARQGPPALDASACPTFCGHLSAFRCPEALASRRGESCVALCARIMTSGQEDLHLACTIAATDVDAVRACGVRCLQPPTAAP